jgi:NAD(P)H-hydrate epimerase
VTVADNGLDVSGARAHVVEAADVAGWLPARPTSSHKWRAACWVVAGSPGMTGSAHLAAGAAQRVGAGYVRLSSPGLDHDPQAPTEAVGVPLPAEGWAGTVLDDLDRFAALAVGPGLGTGDAASSGVRELVAGAAVALVVDGDGLTALGTDAGAAIARRAADAPPVVLTPHDGEARRLLGEDVGIDRCAAARTLAERTGAVVLLKGSTTIVAEPGGALLLTNTGDARLATAGTGDVLTGTLAGLLAQGLPAPHAAAAAAYLHGRAGALGWRRGLVASDLVALLPAALAELPET